MNNHIHVFTNPSDAMDHGFAQFDARPFQLMESDLKTLDIRFPIAVIQSNHDFRLHCKSGVKVADLTNLYADGPIPELIFLILKEIQRYELMIIPSSPDEQSVSAFSRANKIFLIDTIWSQLDSKTQICLLSDQDKVVAMAANLAAQKSSSSVLCV